MAHDADPYRPPAPLLLAALASARSARFVVVGSAALRLNGIDLPVHDLDIVPDLDLRNLNALRDLVGHYGLGRRPRWGSAPGLLSTLIASASTIYGRLDIMIGRAVEDGPALRRDATVVEVCGVPVTVASAASAWDLRARFKAPARVPAVLRR